MVCLDGIEDWEEKTAYYQSHEKERRAIAENGYQKVKKHHTYVNRIEEILKIVKEN